MKQNRQEARVPKNLRLLDGILFVSYLNSIILKGGHFNLNRSPPDIMTCAGLPICLCKYLNGLDRKIDPRHTLRPCYSRFVAVSRVCCWKSWFLVVPLLVMGHKTQLSAVPTLNQVTFISILLVIIIFIFKEAPLEVKQLAPGGGMIIILYYKLLIGQSYFISSITV